MINESLFRINEMVNIAPVLSVRGDIHAKWIFSLNNYIIGVLFLLLIIWNIWLTKKLKTQNRSKMNNNPKSQHKVLLEENELHTKTTK